MARNIARKLIDNHLLSGRAVVGEEIGLRIDQTLTQDATGTMVMLELEALGLDRVRTELSAQYVDHNLIQADFRNPDDHRFLRSACRRFGLWYSRPGNGVSHPVHMERCGAPGKTLLGADSHTPAAGALGMLAIGAGGLDVAMAMAGEPFFLKMPRIRGVRLIGHLPDWVSAKDVILEMLRRHGVAGGVGWIVEYGGSGLEGLSAMDRHVIANMGAELGATTTVFPSDEAVRLFLRAQGREDVFVEIHADPGCDYDETEEIDLSRLEPLIALPGSPGSVVPVEKVAGKPIGQAYIGSSANPGFRDIAVVAEILAGRQVESRVSLDINPASRQVLENLIARGYLEKLVHAGARIHQCGCNGCIGMGQAPGTGQISLRTVPRNFPGRSGTPADQVYLCSPETAAASALTGQITDPRNLNISCPRVGEPPELHLNATLLEAPALDDRSVPLEKGPNIQPLPTFAPLPDCIEAPVLLKLGDDISTDEILPAGARVLPFRSNIPEISKFCFSRLDEGYYERSLPHRETGHILVAGGNYGQGSSREHAVIAPRYLGLQAVLCISFARIHWQNLINFGILPLTFADPADFGRIESGDRLRVAELHRVIRTGRHLTVKNLSRSFEMVVEHALTERQVGILLKGGLINMVRERLQQQQ